MSGFSVCQFFPTGDYEYVRRNVSADEAISAFKDYTSSVGAVMGTTIRVILTDDGDCINMEWERDKGITYPPGSGSENMTLPAVDLHAVVPVPASELNELRRLAAIGAHWEKDSSLESWFPITAENVERLLESNVELLADRDHWKDCARIAGEDSDRLRESRAALLAALSNLALEARHYHNTGGGAHYFTESIERANAVIAKVAKIDSGFHDDKPDERADLHTQTQPGDLTAYGSPLKPGR